MKKALLIPTESGFEQMIRFGLVGAVATVADMGLLAFMVRWLHIWYVISVAAGYGLGLVICYLLSIAWIFPHRSVRNKRLEFAIFVIIGIAALGMTEAIVYSCVELLALDVMVSKLISVFLVFFFNFGARKVILFPSRHKSRPETSSVQH